MTYPAVIIEDSRNQPGKHENIRMFCETHGIRVVRSKLIVGDYTLPTNQQVCVDTKYGLQEVYNNLVQSHDRFARECDLAQQLGIRLVILVEESGIHTLDDVAEWKNPRYERYMAIKNGHKYGRFMGTGLPPKKPVDSVRLMKMMHSFAQHHGCEWRFCSKEQTGAVLMDILTHAED